ncbi:cytochrome P450 4B1-like [Branchiostoma floridae]|uniref:Cytochrome P450 4B1-like n=1 Tax=Branchiostoma floridae TaxID=7739 RepID=A0A9J7MV23_BRAFL|nr:cytochrome P450 4B1-like [Branchiostoma floridae]
MSDNASNTLGFLSRHVFTTALWCVVVLCVAVLLKGTVAVVRSLRNLWALEKVFPVPPGAHWLLGHLVFLRQDARHSYEITAEWFRQYQQGYIFKHGAAMGRLVVTHPDDVRAVLMRTDQKLEIFYGMLRPWLGDGLLLSSGPKWFRNRRLLTPGFHFEILKPYVRLFSESTNVMLNNWKELKPGSSIDVFHHMSLMTLDSMLKCTLSQNTNCQTRKTKDFLSSIDELTELAIQRAWSIYLLSDFMYGLSPSGKRNRAACNIVHKYSEEIIRQRKEVLKQQSAGDSTHGKKYLDFLDILLRAKDENGNGLTDAEIRDEVDTFVFEGHHTTASGLAWALYCLARHPGHQEKCRKEAQEVLQGRTEVTWEDLSSMKYITLCVKESLRLYPAVPEILRDVETPLTFSDGRTVPKGSQVYISMRFLHRNPRIWEKPEEYDPLRFSSENSKGRHPYAFLPFSAGPRNCIGQHFAMNELKTAVALILQRFILTPDDTLPEPFPVERMVLRADSPGLYIKITPFEVE